MYKFFFTFIILASILDYRIFGLNYWDEILVVFVPLYYILDSKKISIKKSKLNIWGTLISLLIIGLVSNILHPEFQSSNIAILKDIVAIIKFPILILVLMKYRISSQQNKISHDAALISKLLLYIMFVTAIVGYFIDIGVYQDEIRLVKCYKFFFSHPTFLVSSLIMMTSILMADGVKRNKKELLVAGVLILLTGRTKGYIMIVLLIFIILKLYIFYNAFDRFSGNLKLKKRYFVLGLLCVGIVGYVLGKAKVIEYMGWGLTAARPALYIVGFDLLKDCFPFGAGFGTFASSISGVHYSNVYNLYHIAGVNGLIQGNTNYIADTFPPYIYGQFGIIGALAYLLLLMKIIRYQFKRIHSYDKMLGFFYLWIYVFVACSAEAFLTNASAAQLAIVLSVYIGCDFYKQTSMECNLGRKS